MSSDPLDYCPTRLISDDPADVDRLGSHGRVARAIGALIRGEAGGRAVALTGTWGSGKSTVLRLLGESLRAPLGTRDAPRGTRESQYRMFVFDAWAHEGDALRRTFLEALGDELAGVQGDDNPWINTTEWRQTREYLARRREDSDTTSTPILAPVGRALLVALLSVPVGLAMLDQSLAAFRVDGAFLSLVPALLVCFLPLVVVATALVLQKLRFWRERRRNPNARLRADGSALALLVNNAVTTTQSRTIRTPEPTSLEFTQHFREMLQAALRDPQRALVIVVDNLDRVDGHSALKIWATLQTFLQPSNPRQPWLARLWIVMSFDRHSVEKHWRQREGEAHGELASSFLDKTFQIQFEVPPPAISNWEDFLKQQLREAFPKHSDQEFHAIYRLIASRRDPETRATTPRELKLLVNQIGAIHRQWCEQPGGYRIPLHHLAYYAVLKRDNPSRNLLDALRKGELPERTSGLFDGDIVGNLAAIAFGVEPAIARQLLLDEEVASALADADDARLSELSKATDAFPAVLDGVIDRYAALWMGGQVAKIFNAAAALTRSGILANSVGARARHLTRVLVDAMIRAEEPGPPPATADGMVALARQSGDASSAAAILVCHERMLTRVSGVQQEIADAVVVGVQAAVDLHLAGLLPEQRMEIAVPGEADDFASTVHLAERRVAGMTGRVRLMPVRGVGETVGTLIELARAGGFKDATLAALRYLAREHDQPWEGAIAPVLQDRLRVGASNNILERVALLEALEVARASAEGEAVAASLTDSGDLAHHLAELSETEAAARIAFLMGMSMPGWRARGDAGRSREGYAFLAEQCIEPGSRFVQLLADRIVANGAKEFIWQLLVERPDSRPLVSALLRLLGMRKELTFFDNRAAQQHWSLYLEALSPQELLAIVPAGDIMRAFEATGITPHNAEFFTAIVPQLDADSALLRWCAERLREMPTDVWEEQFRVGGEVLPLALSCMAAGSPPRLEGAARDALKTSAESFVSGATAAISEWDGTQVLSLLADDYREIVLDDMYRLLSRNPQSVSATFIERFGKPLAEGKRMERDPDAYLEVFEPLALARNAIALQWIANQLEAGQNVFASIPGAHRKPLEDLLSAELRAASVDAAHAPLVRIAEMLEIADAGPQTGPETPR